MYTCEADAAEEPQNHRQHEAVREQREGEARRRTEQPARHVQPARIHPIGRTGEDWDSYCVAGKVDASYPSRPAGIERPIGGYLAQGRREGHERRKVGDQTHRQQHDRSGRSAATVNAVVQSLCIGHFAPVC